VARYSPVFHKPATRCVFMVISTLPDPFRLAIPVRDLDMTEQFHADVSARPEAMAGKYRTFAPPGNLPEPGYHGDLWITP
jgi:hypothetical protein